MVRRPWWILLLSLSALREKLQRGLTESPHRGEALVWLAAAVCIRLEVRCLFSHHPHSGRACWTWGRWALCQWSGERTLCCGRGPPRRTSAVWRRTAGRRALWCRRRCVYKKNHIEIQWKLNQILLCSRLLGFMIRSVLFSENVKSLTAVHQQCTGPRPTDLDWNGPTEGCSLPPTGTSGLLNVGTTARTSLVFAL